MHRSLLTSLILLLLLCGPLAAQSPIVRLGPKDPAVSQLEPELRIESAATIGRITLVVWGASTNDDQGGTRPLLRMQLLDSTSPAGLQQTLHGEAARPRDVVSVVPVSGGFLVLWNDERADAPGIYGRRVGLDGSFLGEESKYADGYIFRGVSWDVRPIGDPSRGQGLVYANPILGGASVLRIDAAGNLIGSSGPHGVVQFQMYSYAALGDLSLISSLGGSRIVHPDGRVDARSPRIASGARAYYIGADSSLATIEQGELRIRQSLFDSLPASSVRIGALDSMLGTSMALHRTTAGDYDVYFAVAASALSGDSKTSRLSATIYRVRYTAAGALQPPVAVTSREKTLPSTVATWDAPMGLVTLGNSNTRLFSITFPTTLNPGTDSVLVGFTTLEFSLDTAGVLRHDQTTGIAVSEAGGPTGFISPLPPEQPVTRRSSQKQSVVRVTLPAGRVDLFGPVAAKTVELPRRRPTIRLVDGELITTAELEGSRYDVSRWSGTEAPATLIQTRAVDTLPAFAIDADKGERILTTTSAATVDMDSAGGPTMLMESAARNDALRLMTGPDTFGAFDSVRTRVRVDIATPRGWVRLLEQESKGVPPNDTYYWTDDAGWNPNQNEKVVITGIWPELSCTMTAFDPDGAATWSTPCVVTSLPTVPVDRMEYLVMGDMEAVRYRGADSIAAYPVMIPAGNVSYRRLLGPSFIRIDESVSGTRVTVDRFDLSLQSLGSASLEFDAPADSYIFQDERDSTLILLHNANGLRMTRIAQDMTVFVRDSLLVPAQAGMLHPEGVVRNDTLFFVWSDMRSGQPDVYGSWIKLDKYVPGTSGVARSAGRSEAAMAITSVAPNPTRGRIELAWTQPARAEARLEVIDRLGRRVMARSMGSMEAGAHSAALALDGLDAGAYLIGIVAGDHRTVAPVVVMP